jgi:hypothetical protein
MTTLASFLAGFLTGWAVRSTVDSPWSLGARVLDAGYRARARVRRWIAVERERIEDLVAEVRARHDLPPEIERLERSANGSRRPAR